MPLMKCSFKYLNIIFGIEISTAALQNNVCTFLLKCQVLTGFMITISTIFR